MTSIVAAFVVAVGGASLIYYLVKWGNNRTVGRKSAGSDDLSIGPVVSSSGESLNLLSWFGSNSSSPEGSSCASDGSAAESSTCSSDSSGGDSGGGDGGGSD